MTSVSLLAFKLQQAGLRPRQQSYMEIAKTLQEHGIQAPEDAVGMEIEALTQGMAEHDKRSLEDRPP